MKITRDDKLFFGIGMGVGWTLIAALFLCVFSGCALLGPCPVDKPADALAQDVQDFAADGTFDPTEFKILCRDAGFVQQALDEKATAPAIPPTGVPWIDAALALAVPLMGYATHKYTMAQRDKSRAVALETVRKNA